MAMRSTQKNIFIELASLVTGLVVVGLIVYHWDFLRSQLREQGRTVAEYIYEQQDSRAARNQQPDKQNNFNTVGYERSVRLQAGFHGQFIAQSYVNDIPLTMMADTGASLVMFTWEDADRLGLLGSLNFNQVAHTANGNGRFAYVTINKMRIGDVELEGVRAGVLEKGKLRISLLGMSFIKRLKRFEMRGKDLVLVQ